MQRRHFLTLGAGGLAAASVPHAARTQAAAASYPAGNFLIGRSADGLLVTHRDAPGRVLWETVAGGDFLVAETATARVQDVGTPQGAFRIDDMVAASFGRPAIDTVDSDGSTVTVRGRLAGDGRGIGFRLAFEALSATHLRFTLATDAPDINRIRLLAASDAAEALFGFGQQLTYVNQKGYLLPILVQEHGVGRGQPGITELVDLLANRGGGTPFTTEAPAPHYLSSRLRSLFLENTDYSTFDMRRPDRIEIKVWSGSMTGRILYGRTPLDLVEAFTAYAGRMRVLPDWIHEGLIIGTQGGTAAVRRKLDAANRAGIPVAALWLQDWTGVRVTSSGRQLWWNWRLDETHYPGWRRLVADLERQGARMLVYINPFLSIEPGHDDLYRDASARGYLVKSADGSPFLNRNTTFSAALVDLSNPAARAWIKEIMKTALIDNAGASGWMHDFGEALPFDAVLYGGADPAAWHNRYPQEWAQVAREAIEEAGRGNDIVFFDRSGFTRSPGASTLFWLGDQIQNWNAFDGIKTAVAGMLSGGMSGASLVHSDTGGYVAFQTVLAGRAIPLIARTPELLMRWTELSAFTAVLRTHEGLVPAISVQFDDSPELLAHMARFARVYRGLGAYRKRYIAEAAARGYPLARHPFLHYPDDPETWGLRYQYLLGPDLLVAPVLDRDARTVDVYFPQGAAWTDLWSGAQAGTPGRWATMPAPLGRPAVFLREGAEAAGLILDGLRGVGVLER